MVSCELISASYSDNFVRNLSFLIFYNFCNNHVALAVLESSQINFGSSLTIFNQRNNCLAAFSFDFEHIGSFHCKLLSNR